MIKSLNLATAALALHLAASPVQAAAAVQPTVLEAVVVTPTARYTASQWQQREASRHAMTLDRVVVTPTARYSVAEWDARSAVATVVLEPVIVTPRARYTLAQWQQRQAGLMQATADAPRHGVRAWLSAVWKHFQFKRKPVEV